MGFLSKLGNRYALGAAVCVPLAASVAIFGAAAYLIVGAAGGALGMDSEGVRLWFILSALVWLPLAVGVAVPAIVSIFGPRVAATNERERRADLARYGGATR